MADGAQEVSYLDHLLVILQQYDPSINENSFISTDANLFISMILAVLQEMGMNVEGILSIQPNAVPIFEINSVLQTSSLKYINMMIVIKKFFEMIELKDFSFIDLIQRRQSKMSQILYELLCFLQHKIECDERFSSKIKLILERNEKYEKLQEELSNNDEKINQMQFNIEETRSKNNEKLKKLAEYDAMIGDKKQLLQKQSERFEEQKKLNSDLNRNKESLISTNKEIQQDIDVLSKDIVQFPQKIIEDAEKCNKKLTLFVDKENSLKARLEEIRSEMESNIKYLEHAKSCVSLPHYRDDDFEGIRKIQDEIDNFKLVSRDIASAMEKSSNEIQYLQEQLEIKELSLKRLEGDIEKKRDEAQDKLDKILVTKDERIIELIEMRSNLKQISEKLNHLKSEVETFDSSNDDGPIGEYLKEIELMFEDINKTL